MNDQTKSGLKFKKIILLPVSFLLILVYAYSFQSTDMAVGNRYFQLFLISALLLLIPFLRNRTLFFKNKAIAKIKIIFWFSVVYFGLYALLVLNQTENIFINSYLLYFTGIAAIIIIILIFQLLLIKRKKRTQRNLWILAVLIFLTAISSMFGPELNSVNARFYFETSGTRISAIFILTMILLSLSSFKTSWVNYLNKKEKFLALLTWLLIIIGAVAIIIPSRSESESFSLSSSLFEFYKIVNLYLLVFSIVSFFSILAHLPSAGIFDRKVKQISSLHSLSSAVCCDILNPKKIADFITELSIDMVNSELSWLIRFDEEKGEYGILSQKPEQSSEYEIVYLMLNHPLNDIIVSSEEPVIVNDINQEFKLLTTRKNKVKGSLIGVRLYSQKWGILGILYVKRHMEFGFEEDDKNMLTALSNQAVVAIENSRLLNESIEKERLEQELKVARDVQLKLLPKKLPVLPGVEIDAVSITANEVGGDYYDFVELKDNRLGLCIGDVSGKGISAAFYMAEVKGIVQSLSRNYNSPKELIVKVNEALFGNIDKKSFISLAYSIVDTDKKNVTYSRAGHTPLLRYSSEKDVCIFHQPAGLGLGLDYNKVFHNIIEEETIPVSNGDVFCYYTDGITEVFNPEGDEFGEDELQSYIMENKHLQSKEIRKGLLKKIAEFKRGTRRHDDMTLVILKFN